MVKVKQFFGYELEEEINTFLAEGKREYVDVKVFGVNNDFSTQCSYMAVLVYKED